MLWNKNALSQEERFYYKYEIEIRTAMNVEPMNI